MVAIVRFSKASKQPRKPHDAHLRVGVLRGRRGSARSHCRVTVSPGGSGTSSMTRSFESGPLEGEPPLELGVVQRDRDAVVVDCTGLAHDDRHEMAGANRSVSLGGPSVDRRAFADLERDSGPQVVPSIQSFTPYGPSLGAVSRAPNSIVWPSSSHIVSNSALSVTIPGTTQSASNSAEGARRRKRRSRRAPRQVLS